MLAAAALHDAGLIPEAPSEAVLRESMIGHATTAVARSDVLPRVLCETAHRLTEGWKAKLGFCPSGRLRPPDIPLNGGENRRGVKRGAHELSPALSDASPDDLIGDN